jgi:hypothetical protein
MGTTIFGDYISFSDGRVGGITYLRESDLYLWVEHHRRAEIVGLYVFFRTADDGAGQERAREIRLEVERYD